MTPELDIEKNNCNTWQTRTSTYKKPLQEIGGLSKSYKGFVTSQGRPIILRQWPKILCLLKYTT